LDDPRYEWDVQGRYVMKQKLLIGALIVLGIAVTTFNPPISVILAVGAWIYLVRVVSIQDHSVVTDHKVPVIAEVHLKRIRALVIVAVFSFLILIVAAILHNASHDLSERRQTVTLLIALVALWVFVAATAAGMVIFLTTRQRTAEKA